MWPASKRQKQPQYERGGRGNSQSVTRREGFHTVCVSLCAGAVVVSVAILVKTASATTAVGQRLLLRVTDVVAFDRRRRRAGRRLGDSVLRRY